MSERTSKERARFWKAFTLMVQVGFPLREILRITSQEEDEKFKSVVSKISESLGGEAFSSAMRKHPETFSEFEIAMIEAGEREGNLDVITKNLAEFFLKFS